MTTSTLQNPVFTYPASGTYNVTLTVTDNDGASSAPVVIPVTVSDAVAGDLIVSSFTSDVFYKMDGFSSTSLGSLASTNSALSTMPDGDILVLEAGGTFNLTKRDPTSPFGVVSTVSLGLGTGGTGISADAAGNIYSCTANGADVIKYVGFSSTVDTTITLQAADNPRQIEIDKDGNLIAVGRNGSNENITRYVGFSTTIDSFFARIDDGGQPGVSIDNAGNIYQCDNLTDDVHKMVGFSSTIDTTISITQITDAVSITITNRLA